MEEQNNFEDYIKMNNITVGIEVTESSAPTIIELTDSQLELIQNNGNCYYNSQSTYYSLPFWFKHIEGNKFEMLLNNKE